MTPDLERAVELAREWEANRNPTSNSTMATRRTDIFASALLHLVGKLGRNELEDVLCKQRFPIVRKLEQGNVGVYADEIAIAVRQHCGLEK